MFNLYLLVVGLILFIPLVSVSATSLESTKSAAMAAQGRVPARAQDLLFEFKNDKIDAVVGAEEEITYTMTYGSKLSYGTPMTIEVEWSLGTVPDASLYSYNILSYVAGSATKDYWGESTPTIDLVHRKITWVVKRFPPSTIGKTLSFTLKTPGLYVTDRNVNFNVKARMIQGDVTQGWVSLDNIYSPTEFIRRELKGLHLLTADLRRITDRSFSLFIVTTEKARTVIYYGLSSENLDKTVTDTELSDQKLITIDGLSPSTMYYYRILIENERDIQRKTPETFKVTTASTSLIGLLEQDRVIITTRGIVLSSLGGIGPDTQVVVPRGVPIDIILPFRAHIPQSVYVSLSEQISPRENVLGLTTEDPINTSSQKVRFLETQPNVFSGSITVPERAGTYDVIMEADTVLTGTNRDVLTTLVVTRPITVTDEAGTPIEHALVYVERFDETTQTYHFFPAGTYGGANPTYSDSDGTVDIVLPTGQYSINVNAPGFETYQTKFHLTELVSQTYPTLKLTKAPIQVMSHVSYYWAVIVDLYKLANWNIDKLSTSWRFLDMMLILTLVILTALSYIVNVHRLKLTAESVWIFLEKRMFKMFHTPDVETLFIGFVEHEGSELPVHHAVVLLIDKKTKAVVTRDVTSGLGEFRIHIDPSREYELQIKKSGMSSIRTTVGVNTLLSGHDPFQLTADATVHSHPFLEFLVALGRAIFHALSDTLLVTVGILNLILFLRLGFHILPTIILTGINGFLWIEYQWHLWSVARRVRS